VFHIFPEEGGLESLLTSYPADTPVVMLNLLRFRAQAAYPADHDAQPCSGAEAFGRYGQAVAPLLEARGAEPIWQGRQAAMLIGPQDKDWHLAVLVRYPGAAAFVEMATSEAYQSIVVHRTAALEDSRLIAFQPL
jgi:uncharacterized protein (DUF1330 family)